MQDLNLKAIYYITMATFPALQGIASTGKIKVWSIRVIDENGSGVIETTHGYADGKMQVTRKIVSVGKNIGKKNETTPIQQAISEASATFLKKKESDYTLINGGVSSQNNDIARDEDKNNADDDDDDEEDEKKERKGARSADITIPSPMLAHDYTKRGHNMKFPCYTQRKYDGVRCLGVPGIGLFSRLRKAFPHMEHILNELKGIPSTIVLDGELYCKELTFQEIVGLVKKVTLTDADILKQYHIKYHVYDMINLADTTETYTTRYQTLQMLFDKYPFQHLKLVKTDMCADDGQMKQFHSEYIADGFEGVILRNMDGLYKQSRSADLQKYKEFFDAEYEIVGSTEGMGLEAGCVIWICKTDTGGVFNVRPRGSREERQQLYQDGARYVGKMLTVRYQELTSSVERVPRFGVGIAIRDYEGDN
jgi:DNA ligase-1